VDKLTEEDRLMRQFACVERFGTKLQIMSFMASFDDSVKNVRPQVSTLLKIFFFSSPTLQTAKLECLPCQAFSVKSISWPTVVEQMVEQLTNDPELEGLNPAIPGIWE